MGYPKSLSKGNTGLIHTKGLYVNGTDLKLHDYQMRVSSGLYTGNDGVVVDFTSLVAAEYYAVCMKESDGVISVQVIDDFDNWTRSSSVFNMDDIYDADRGYCYDTISGTGYRIFFVFRANSTPNGIRVTNNVTMGFEVFNRPKTFIVLIETVQQTIGSGAFTKIAFDSPTIDLTGEFDTTNYEYDPSRTKSFLMTSQCRWISGNWALGKRYDMYIYRNGSSISQEQNEVDGNNSSTTMNNRAVLSTQGNVGDSYDIRVYQSTGGNRNIGEMRLQIQEFET